VLLLPRAQTSSLCVGSTFDNMDVDPPCNHNGYVPPTQSKVVGALGGSNTYIHPGFNLSKFPGPYHPNLLSQLYSADCSTNSGDTSEGENGTETHVAMCRRMSDDNYCNSRNTWFQKEIKKDLKYWPSIQVSVALVHEQTTVTPLIVVTQRVLFRGLVTVSIPLQNTQQSDNISVGGRICFFHNRHQIRV